MFDLEDIETHIPQEVEERYERLTDEQLDKFTEAFLYSAGDEDITVENLTEKKVKDLVIQSIIKALDKAEEKNIKDNWENGLDLL